MNQFKQPPRFLPIRTRTTMKMKLRIALITLLAAIANVAHADVVVTKNGSSINGKIMGIDKGKITIATDFAGEIVVDQAQVTSFSTDDPVYVSTEAGSTYLGPVKGDNSGLTVVSEDGEVATTIADVTEGWQPGAQSPTAIRQAAALESLKRKWAYEAAFDYAGKTGNTTSNGLAASFRATLEGMEDKLEFYARTRYEDTDGVKSADDARGGVDYTNELNNDFNWYVRSEFGRDLIKSIEMYSTAAAGFGYSFMDTDTRDFNVRTGLGYYFESYEDSDTESTNAISLDFGLFHEEIFKWGTLTNRLTYTPTIEDLGVFRLNHDSSVELPLKIQGWSIRTGISNSYDSQAKEISGKEELDTTYYVRMVLKWL